MNYITNLIEVGQSNFYKYKLKNMCSLHFFILQWLEMYQSVSHGMIKVEGTNQLVPNSSCNSMEELRSPEQVGDYSD